MKKQYLIIWFDKDQRDSDIVHHTPVQFNMLESFKAEKIWDQIKSSFVAAEPAVKSEDGSIKKSVFIVSVNLL